jgi:hypothetical protein
MYERETSTALSEISFFCILENRILTAKEPDFKFSVTGLYRVFFALLAFNKYFTE